MSTNQKTIWKEAALDEMAFINPSTPLPKGAIATHIAMEDLEPFSRKIRHYSKKKFTGGTKFQNRDTLVARITPSLENGKTAFVDVLPDGETGFGSTEFIVLREKAKTSDAKYLYYFAITPSFRDLAIKSMTGTSGRQRVQTDVIAMSRFHFPPIQEQQLIAAVLSSLDDKIELLKKQNETLEQIARAIFDERFSENSSDAQSMLSDFVEHTKVQVAPGKTANTIFNHYSIPAYDNGKAPDKEMGSQILSNKYKVISDSILFSKLNPRTPRVWAIFEPFDNAICSTEFQVLTLKEKKLLPFVYVFLSFSEQSRELANKVQGTSGSHQRLRPEDILSIEFPKPDAKTIDDYCTLTYPMLKKIEENRVQIGALATLRNELLPRLISGELKVSN